MAEIGKNLIDKLIADHEQLGRDIDEIKALYPQEIVLNANPGDNLQIMLDSLNETGGLINLSPGTYNDSPVLNYKNKLVTLHGTGDDATSVTLRGFKAGIRTGNISFDNLSFINSIATAHVELGADRTTQKLVSDIPVGFTFTNVNFVGPARRAISANCAFLLVDNCSMKDYRQIAQDSQAIIGWNGSRNHIIRNSFLEAASENLIYGGADAALEEMFPRDILIENCVLSKRPEWKLANYNLKSIFELKCAINCTFRRNHITGNYKQAWGNAPAISIKSSNQENSNPNARCENVLVELNTVENVGCYVELVGKDDGPYTSGILKDITFRNNLFQLLNTEPDGRAFSMSSGPINVTIDHNTIFDNRLVFVEEWDNTSVNLQVMNNIAHHGIYGIRPYASGMNPYYHHNAIQVRSSDQPQVKMGPTNIFYTDVHNFDHSLHVTSDGLEVGAILD